MNNQEQTPAPGEPLLPCSYTVNENNLVVLSMTEPQLLAWLGGIKKEQASAADMRHDMKVLKDNILEVLKVLKVVNKDGTNNPKFRFSSTLGMLGTLTNPQKMQEKFSFLQNLSPLVEKYKHL